MKQTINKTFSTVLENRFVLMVWMSMCLILSSSYSGVIYNTIAFPYEYKIESIVDLYKAQNEGKLQIITYPAYKNLINVIHIIKIKYSIIINFLGQHNSP